MRNSTRLCNALFQDIRTLRHHMCRHSVGRRQDIEINLQSHEILAEAVVQFPGNAAPFLILQSEYSPA